MGGAHGLAFLLFWLAVATDLMDGRVARRYGILGYPTTVVIDRDGRMLLSELGAWDWGHPDAMAWLRELLAQ